MPNVRRIASSLLLAAGIVLVLAGINSALGFRLAGIVASVTAIAGLLYAGAVWFGPRAAAPDDVVIFDHRLRLAGGSSLLARFPAAHHDEVRIKAMAALAGARASLVVQGRAFVMTPILSEQGTVLYGALVETRAQRTATL